MMRKPEKRIRNEITVEAAMWDDGYNKACCDWEAWLKEVVSAEKIWEIIGGIEHEIEDSEQEKILELLEKVVEVISERISK